MADAARCPLVAVAGRRPDAADAGQRRLRAVAGTGRRSAAAPRGWSFYTFIGNVARFMCSWATTEAAVEALVADVALAVAALARIIS